MITERGVYNDLTESRYIVSNGDVSLYFSSKIYMMRFLERYKENRTKNKKRMERFAGNTIFKFDLWYDIHLYMNIEKRGYHCTVWHKKGYIPKDELERYALSKVSQNVIRDWVKK